MGTVGPGAHLHTAASVISFILVFNTHDARPLFLASLAGRSMNISIILSNLWSDSGDLSSGLFSPVAVAPSEGALHEPRLAPPAEACGRAVEMASEPSRSSGAMTLKFCCGGAILSRRRRRAEVRQLLSR